MKLNLGCGHKKMEGYVNVDVHGDPDVTHDLEQTPWPWEESTVDEVQMIHVLEHLAPDTKTYLEIWQELYRICKDGALIKIIVPHPRHDFFLNDPTHVRAVTPVGLEMLSQKKNREWIEHGFSNTPIGLNIGVDFEITKLTNHLDVYWIQQLQSGAVQESELELISRKFNNVISEYHLEMKAIKA